MDYFKDIMKQKIGTNYPKIKNNLALTEGMMNLVNSEELQFAHWYSCYCFYLKMFYIGIVKEEYLSYYCERLVKIKVSPINNKENEEYTKALNFLKTIKNGRTGNSPNEKKITITPSKGR